MARNNETFGRVSTPSAGGSGAATTVFGGTIDTVTQQRLNQRRLGAQLRDPDEPGLLGQEPHDPNRIIITEDMIAKPAEPETPEMARASALRHAAFRTGAELSLLSGLETVKARTFGNPDLDDREAASLFRQNAALLTRDAIEGMSRAFGSPEDGLEMPTRAVLEDITEGAASEGARARARGLEDKALDILEAGADDLLAQIRSAPDLASGYGAQMEAMTARYEGGIDADALAAFRANMAAEMAQARVLGLAQAGRFDEARTVMGEVELSEAQQATLEQALEAETERASEMAQATRARRRLALELAARESEAGAVAIVEAEASGALSPVDARRLTQLAAERRTREARNGDLIAGVEQALEGEGPAPDAATAEGREALELYLERVLMPALAEDDPAFRDAGVAWLAGRFGRVPDSVQRELLAQIQPGQPAAVRMAAVNRIAAIAEAGDGALIEAFPRDVREFVNTALQARHETDQERLAYADSKVEITSTPQAEEERGEDPESPMGAQFDASSLIPLRGTAQGLELGTAYMALPDTDLLADVPVGATDAVLAGLDTPALQALAGSRGHESVAALITETLSDPNRMHVGAAIGESRFIQDLGDGTSFVVTMQMGRDGEGRAVFQVTNADIQNNDRMIALERGPAPNVMDVLPLILDPELATDDEGRVIDVVESVRMIDRTTGQELVFGADRFAELTRNQRISLGLPVPSLNPLDEVAGELLLDITPGIGNVRALDSAADNFEDAGEAFASGEILAGLGESGLSAVDVVGAVPILGNVVRGPVRFLIGVGRAERIITNPNRIKNVLLGLALRNDNSRERLETAKAALLRRLPELDPDLDPFQALSRTSWPPASPQDAEIRAFASLDILVMSVMKGGRHEVSDVLDLRPMLAGRLEDDALTGLRIGDAEGMQQPLGLMFHWGSIGDVGNPSRFTRGIGRNSGAEGWAHILSKHGPESVEAVVGVLTSAETKVDFDAATRTIELVHENVEGFGRVELFLSIKEMGNVDQGIRRVAIISGFKATRLQVDTLFNNSMIAGPLTFTAPAGF